MVISDIFNIELPDDLQINFMHLGFIYCLDTDKDGRFYIEDLYKFAEEIMQKIGELTNNNQKNEIEGQI